VTQTADVVLGLESGADDYVTKPFVPEEPPRPGARPPSSPSRKEHQRLQLEHCASFLTKEFVRHSDGAELHLTSTEFRLLTDLAAANGKVLSREDLLEHVWGYDYFGDSRLVDVHIRRLRMKIEPDPASPTYLVTVRGTGYKLVI